MEEPYLSYCRKLQILTPSQSPASSPNKSDESSELDYNVVVILSAMICALVCALGLHSMLQCVVRCTRRVLADPAEWVTSRRLTAGLKTKDVFAIPVATYAAPSSASSASVAGCAICLVDFSDGDTIRVLPACGHRFHIACIDKWLLSHCSCPTCRHRLVAPLEVVTGA